MWISVLPAKEKKKEAEKHPSSTFQVNVNLVSVNVNVTDRRGVPVPDLTEKDFQVLDNGAPQKISVFRVETIPGAGPSGPNAPSPQASATTARKVILFVDDYDTDFATMVYVRKAGEQFIRAGLGPEDLVALITASGRHSTEFTMDRKFVIDNLNQVFPVTPESKGREACPPLDPYQAIMIQEGIWSRDKEMVTMQIPQLEELIAATAACACPKSCPPDMIMELIKAAAQRLAYQSLDWSRRVLYSLQALNRRLSAIKGPKELVLLSPGFMLGAPIVGELQYELNRTIDAAIRANTVIDSVNVAGLVPDVSPHRLFRR